MNNCLNFEITTDFKDWLTPLSGDEFKKLEKNLLVEGCRDPLVVWMDPEASKYLLIDGHNRWDLIKKHSLPFTTVEKRDLKTRTHVKEWMFENQIGKRNLTTAQKALMAIKLEPVYAELAKERQHQGRPKGGKELPQDLAEDNKEQLKEVIKKEKTENESRFKAAKEVGISHETVRKMKRIIEAAPEELKQSVMDGKTTIDKANRELNKVERRENYQKMEWPKGKFRVILADPPWSYELKKPGHGDTDDHYDTLSIEQICELPVRDLVDKECVLFLWVTAPLLQKAFIVLDAWGFSYRTSFVWDKGGKNIGSYSFVNHEYLILATYGDKPLTPEGDKPDSVIRVEKSRKHSEKPEEFRAIVDAMYPNGNRIELFGRKKVEGWQVYGNDEALK